MSGLVLGQLPSSMRSVRAVSAAAISAAVNVLWPGACQVHEIFSERKLVQLKVRYPEAKVLAHPECEQSVLAHADYIGSTRGMEVIDRILAGTDGERNVRLLEELCETMVQGSLCGLGGMAPFPVQSALKHFREDFRTRTRQ